MALGSASDLEHNARQCTQAGVSSDHPQQPIEAANRLRSCQEGAHRDQEPQSYYHTSVSFFVMVLMCQIEICP